MSRHIGSPRAPFLLVAPGVVVPDDAAIGANVVIRSGVVLGSGVVIEDGVVLGKVPTIKAGSDSPQPAPATTRIGDGAVVGSHTVVNVGAHIGVNAFVGDHVLIRENTLMGEGSSLGHGSTLALNAVFGAGSRSQSCCAIGVGVEVGEDSFLGPAVVILSGMTMSDRDGGPARIGTGVRIGSGSQILPRVQVGDEAVVGSGSVVTRDVPPGVTVAGVPAKPLGWREDPSPILSIGGNRPL